MKLLSAELILLIAGSGARAGQWPAPGCSLQSWSGIKKRGRSGSSLPLPMNFKLAAHVWGEPLVFIFLSRVRQRVLLRSFKQALFTRFLCVVPKSSKDPSWSGG